MKRALLLILMLAGVQSFGQVDTTRVLFIGNSFTYMNDVPTLVQGLATAAGYQLKFVMHAPGGISVGDVAQGTSAHMNNPIVFDLIRSDNWDFVTLQDNQGRFIYGNCTFPNTTVSKVIEGHIKIKDSVQYYHPCAHMLWFAGWGPKTGYSGVSTTAEGLIDNIYYNYQCLRDTAGEIIAPIGKAWERERGELPLIDLWGPDQTHESLAGAYLTAAVIFTSIYRINTELVAFDGGLDSASARTLGRIARQTVTDSLITTHLADYLLSLYLGSNKLIATPGYQAYQWFLNDSLIASGGSDSLSLTKNGCYYVVATDTNGCKSRSFQNCIGSLGVADLGSGSGVKVYPTPASKVLTIDVGNQYPAHFTLTDITGKVVKELDLVSLESQLNITDLPSGLYYASVYGRKGVVRVKVIKE